MKCISFAGELCDNVKRNGLTDLKIQNNESAAACDKPGHQTNVSQSLAGPIMHARFLEARIPLAGIPREVTVREGKNEG